MGGIALQPALHAPAVILLAPEQTGQGTAVHQALFRRKTRHAVLHVGLPLLLPVGEQGIEGLTERS